MATSIGLVAGCLSSWSLVPQLLKCWRDGLTEAVSKKMFATRAFGLVLWVVYGVFAGSPPVVIFSSINLVLSVTILVLTLRNSSAPEAHTPRRERPHARLPLNLRASLPRLPGGANSSAARLRRGLMSAFG